MLTRPHGPSTTGSLRSQDHDEITLPLPELFDRRGTAPLSVRTPQLVRGGSVLVSKGGSIFLSGEGWRACLGRGTCILSFQPTKKRLCIRPMLGFSALAPM